MINVTISGNTANTNGGINALNQGNPIMFNSIIVGNEPSQIKLSNSTQMTISYSNIEGGQDSIATNDNGTVIWGDGNVDIDPVFVNADNGDYHLSDLSPVISAAASEVTIEGVLSFFG